MKTPYVARVILYVPDIPSVASFYQRHFSLFPLPSESARWLELQSSSGDCTIALHQASKSQKSGAAIKIVFGVSDVLAFREQKIKEGLEFGEVYDIDGFMFSNAKDPAGNAIQISSR